MEAGGSLRRQSSLVADSLKGAPSHLVDPATGPNRGGQNWGNSVIESGEIPLILVTRPPLPTGEPCPRGEETLTAAPGLCDADRMRTGALLIGLTTALSR